MAPTFVDEIEEVVDEVSTWGLETIHNVLEVLAPDGRGYGQEKVDIEKQLDEYRAIRNDPNAWMAWVQAKAIEIQNTLVNSGVGQDTLSAIDLTDIATAMMLDYSSKMEEELNKRMI